MDKLFTYNITTGTSVTPVVLDYQVSLENTYDIIKAIGIVKITGADDEVKIAIQDDVKTIFNKAPVSAVYQLDTRLNKPNLLLNCHIKIVNNQIKVTLTADSISTAVNYDIVLLLAKSKETSEPERTFDYQLQKFAFSSGQSDWADGDIHGKTLARFKDTHQRVTGILVQCPVAGRIGIKDGNNNYLVNRIHKDFLQYNIEIPLEERFYPIRIDNIKNQQFGVEFKPLSQLIADTYIDIVFLLEKDIPHLKGLSGKVQVLTFTIKKPVISIDGKESEYFDKYGEFHMTQKRIPGVQIHGHVYYNIYGELEFKNKKYFLFSHYLMPHVCMFEDEAYYNLVGYQEWKKDDLLLKFYI